MATGVPPSLKQIQVFVVHATQLEKHDPLMSYHCRYYAIQEGIKLRTSHTDDGSKKFLIQQMDALEKQKVSLGAKLEDPNNGKSYAEQFSLRVFDVADNEDRAGTANKNTAKNFLAASQFIEVLKQFGELSDELTEKQRYAKWKAVDISTALKNGLTPKPGGPDDNESNELNGDGKEDTNNIPQPMLPPTNSGKFDEPEVPTYQGNKDTTNIAHPNNVNSPTVNSFPTIIPRNISNTFPQTVPQTVQPPTNYSTQVSNDSTYHPSDENRATAQKYSKFVVSALDYEDFPTAVKYLKLALKQLTGTDYA